jgi:hypothetical protein
MVQYGVIPYAKLYCLLVRASIHNDMATPEYMQDLSSHIACNVKHISTDNGAKRLPLTRTLGIFDWLLTYRSIMSKKALGESIL